MSRIGKQPVKIPAGVKIEIKAGNVKVSGTKGDLNQDFLSEYVSVKEEDGQIIISEASDDKKCSAFSGLTRSLIANMIEGVTKGFSKSLEIQGVGYRAAMKGKQLNLSLGFSHPVLLDIPEGLKVDLPQDKKNVIVVSGIDKQKVGQFAAEIREYKKPEPYKGKGIRYVGEYVTRKAGKSASASD
ncbi:50S ribosomal protein L6 [Candidatus Gracilibacteria bacterium]|nr:50S ribosomal protein L6 [Candidatus Gracilibacteria bacterium]